MLHADRKQKQNHTDENLPALHQEWSLLGEGIGLTLNQKNLLSLRTRSRIKSSIFFDTVNRYNEEDDGAVQFWRIKFYLWNQFPQNQFWSDDHWKAYAWQQEEDQKEHISTALIFQEQLFTSELFKDTQDVGSLILHYKTM